MRLGVMIIAIFLTASVALSHANPGRSDCPVRELGTLLAERANWPNFTDARLRANAIETLRLDRFANEADPLQAMLSSLQSRGGPEYALTRRKMYYNLLDRYGILIEKGNGASLFHGSNSASLVSVMKVEGGPRGLVPAGQLIERGEVPFSGELLPGISEGGVNRNHLSVTTFNYLDLAMQYATKNGKYSPEMSRKNIAEYGKRMQQFKDSNNEAMAQAASVRIEVERKRIARWEVLSPLEKELIERDFPVLYGIRRHPDQKPLRGIPTRVGTWELLIPDGVKPEEIVSVFVPAARVAFVRDHLAFGNRIEVSPIEPVLGQAMNTGKFRELFSKGIAEGD